MNIDKMLEEINNIKSDIFEEEGVEDSIYLTREGQTAFQILNLLEQVLKSGKD